jgi:hypothetical protein
MAIFSAYFDESTGNNSPVLVVAGFLSDDAHWSLFETEWKAALSEFGISAFHMQHFAAQKEAFWGWEEATRRALLGKLLGIIKHRVLLGFASVVHVDAFESVFAGPRRSAIGSPYNLCCLSCAVQIGEWARSNYQIEPVGYFFDAGHKNAGGALETLLEQKNDPDLIEYRIGPIAFESDEVLVPIQAADLAAYEIWRWLDAHFAAKPRHGRFPLQEIIKIPWKIREFDQEVLLELLAVQQGLPVNPRTIRHTIQALRPGQTDPPLV